tara:strand:+ start:304 stop:570 length:267 start_codon:yes stop_codon:yes gene_type:complete
MMRYKTKLKVAMVLVTMLMLGSVVWLAFYSVAWVLLALVFFYLIVYLYRRYLIAIRDDANFLTVRGKATIKACNEKIETLSGFRIFDR